MQKYTLIITLILLGAVSFSAYSKDATISRDTVLYVQDHAGDNFLVLKVESCSLGNKGEVHCAMKPQEKAQAIQAGPVGSRWNKLAYPG